MHLQTAIYSDGRQLLNVQSPSPSRPSREMKYGTSVVQEPRGVARVVRQNTRRTRAFER